MKDLDPDDRTPTTLDAEMSFEGLLAYGISELERLATHGWTDFNAHDPGITILEQVCWALTDFGYRLGHPMADILAEADPVGGVGLVDPAEAFSTAPVTLDDLRALVFDVDGVENVWITPDPTPMPNVYFDPDTQTLSVSPTEVTAKPMAMQGLWKVVVAGQNLPTHEDGPLQTRVAARLFASRPLCQDFTSIEVLDPEPIFIDAEIEIDPSCEAESLLLDLMGALDRAISPRPSFERPDRLAASGAALEDIFNGPKLRSGCLDRQSLPPADRPSALYVSTLVRAIMDLAPKGVRAVQSLSLARAAHGQTVPQSDWQDWVLPLDGAKAPRLALNVDRIRLTRNRVPVRLNTKAIAAYLEHQRDRVSGRPETTAAMSFAPKPGRKRNLGAYPTVQTQFPAVYGLNVGEVSGSGDPRRHSQVLQLRGYLHIIDQLLADQFAQLAHSATVLSGSDPEAKAYRAGHIQSDGIDLASVRKNPADYDRDQHARVSQQSDTLQALALRRRQLDHLLARFGESYTDPDFGMGRAESPDQAGLENRGRVLETVLVNSARRGTAPADVTPDPTSDHVIGDFCDRLRRKLGLAHESAFLVVEHILLRPSLIDLDQSGGLLDQVASADPYSFQLTFLLSEDLIAGVAPDDLPTYQTQLEHMIREEVPAHLMAYAVWVSPDTFKAAQSQVTAWQSQRRSALVEWFGRKVTA